MRRSALLALVVATGAAVTLLGGPAALDLLSPQLLAQDAGDEAAPEVPKRVERAKRILIALEAAMARAHRAEPKDDAFIEQLATAIDDARAMTKPITAAELTDAERKALEEELGTGDDGAGDEAEQRRQEWADRALAQAFEDAGLSEEEEASASPIISAWYGEFLASRGDSKRQSDLKKARDTDLRKLLGRKKANKVINNLNGLGGWGRGR